MSATDDGDGSSTSSEVDWTGTTWEEIHRKIVERSVDSKLVIVNMPDPPEAERVAAEGSCFADADVSRMVGFMEYMEGLADSLPRVLFLHGAGQELIRFDLL